MSSHQSPRSSSSSLAETTAATSPPSSRASAPPRSSSDLSSSPRTPSPLNPNSYSQSPSPTPPSRSALLHTPPPASARIRLHSFAGRDPSPVREALVPLSRVSSAPAVSLSTAAANSLSIVDAPIASSSLFRPSLGASAADRGNESDHERSVTTALTWWSHRLHPPRPWAEPSKRKRTVPTEQVEGYVHTRSVCRPSRFVPIFHLRVHSAPSKP